MGRNGGANNNSANGRTVSWQKTKRIKARVSKKLAGTKERHAQVAVKGVSGARTKKHQRKVDRRKRLDAKEAAALEAAMDVDQLIPAAKKNKLAKKKKTAASTKDTATDAPAPMQE